jgi:molybdenum cofactor cytidylyltransferase
MIAAVVLAAGLSRRMGRSKLVLPIGGQPVIRHAVEGALRGGVDRVLVVVGPGGAEIKQALAGLPVEFAVNPRPEEGQGASISAGVAALPPATEAALVVLGDQPGIEPRVVHELIAMFRRIDKAIVAPRYRGQQGNPVLFGREALPELIALTGDRGARMVVERSADRVAFVDFDLPMPADIDTPEDYDRLRRSGVN